MLKIRFFKNTWIVETIDAKWTIDITEIATYADDSQTQFAADNWELVNEQNTRIFTKDRWTALKRRATRCSTLAKWGQSTAIFFCGNRAVGFIPIRRCFRHV